METDDSPRLKFTRQAMPETVGRVAVMFAKQAGRVPADVALLVSDPFGGGGIVINNLHSKDAFTSMLAMRTYCLGAWVDSYAVMFNTVEELNGSISSMSVITCFGDLRELTVYPLLQGERGPFIDLDTFQKFSMAEVSDEGIPPDIRCLFEITGYAEEPSVAHRMYAASRWRDHYSKVLGTAARASMSN